MEWIVASTEVDALMLEYNLIQQHKPRFNIRYRDDKSYPYLALTVGEKWPRAQVLRGTKRKGVRYFGPVRARLGDPRHARRADARVPGPDVLERVLRPAGPGQAAVPVLRHRPVRRPVRARDDRRHRGVLPSARRRDGRVPRGQRAAGAPRGSSPRCATAAERQEFEQAAQAPRPALRRTPRARVPGDGADAARGPRRDRARRGRPRGRRSRCSSSGAAGCSAAAGGSSTGSRTSIAPGWSRRSSSSSTWSAARCPPRVLVPGDAGRARRSSRRG